MSFSIRPVEYFYVNVPDDLAAASRLLAQLQQLGVNLLAFTAVPSGDRFAQFALFPDDSSRLVDQAAAARIPLEGPHHALLAQGDDELGALADVHRRLLDARIDIYASTGVTDGRGAFGYIVYVRENQFAHAVEALGLEALR